MLCVSRAVQEREASCFPHSGLPATLATLCRWRAISRGAAVLQTAALATPDRLLTHTPPHTPTTPRTTQPTLYSYKTTALRWSAAMITNPSDVCKVSLSQKQNDTRSSHGTALRAFLEGVQQSFSTKVHPYFLKYRQQRPSQEIVFLRGLAGQRFV